MFTHAGRALTAVASLSLLAVAGCNPAGPSADPAAPAASASSDQFGGEVTGSLRTSGFNPSDEVGKARSDLAAKKLSGVTVTMDTTSFDTQKFAAQVASGSAPDLIQVDRNVVGTLADKGLIVPLDACYAQHQVVPDERYYPAAVIDVTYDQQVYGVPQFFQTSLIIANRTVMDEAGVTAADLDTSKPDQLLAAARKMVKTSGGNPSVLGFDGDIPGSSAIWLHAFGGRTVDEQGKPTLDQAENVAAVTWLKQLMDAQGGYAKVKSFKDSMDVFGDNNQYVKDQVGAQTWAQWYINVLSNTQDKVKVEGIPLKDKDGKAFGMAGGSAFAVPKSSKNPAAACAWALEVTSPEAWKAAGDARATVVQQKKAINTGLFTASAEADEQVRSSHVKASGNADFDQLIDTSYQTLENPVPLGASPVGQQVSDALNNAVIVVLSGEQEPEAALKQAQATAMRAWQQSTLGKKLG